LRTSTRDLMTRPSSEPYYRKHRPPLNNCFEKRTSTSPVTNGPRTSSGGGGGGKTEPPAPPGAAHHHPPKRWEKRPREKVHAIGPPISRARGAPRGGERTLDDILDAQCPYHKDMCHTLRNCRDFKHSVGNGRPFQPRKCSVGHPRTSLVRLTQSQLLASICVSYIQKNTYAK
jgi:hypothetical protein